MTTDDLQTPPSHLIPQWILQTADTIHSHNPKERERERERETETEKRERERERERQRRGRGREMYPSEIEGLERVVLCEGGHQLTASLVSHLVA